MYTDHTLPSNSMTVDAHERSLDTYFTTGVDYPTYGIGRLTV